MTLPSHSLNLSTLPDDYMICRFEPDTAVPEWALSGNFFSITRTDEELSIVCPQNSIPAGVQCEPDWRCFKVAGPMAFGLTGIVASLTNPLAEAGVGIFVVSTYDTDYILVKSTDFDSAVAAMQGAGHSITV